MAMSDYMRWLRQKVGHALVVMPSVTAIIVNERDQILLAEDVSTGLWTAPGGSVDPGETPTSAVVREVREELGLRVEPRRLLGVFGGPDFLVEYKNGDRVQYVASVFHCDVLSGEMVLDDDELAQARFVGDVQHESLALAPWLRRVLSLIDLDGEQARFDPLLDGYRHDISSEEG